jgi:hypothetical protein
MVDAEIRVPYIDSAGGWGPGSMSSAFIISEPVVPPPGVTIEKQQVSFSEIRRIEWTKLSYIGGDVMSGKVVFRDGKAKEVFLYTKDGNHGLEPIWVEVVGKLEGSGEVSKATYKDAALRVIEIGPSK